MLLPKESKTHIKGRKPAAGYIDKCWSSLASIEYITSTIELHNIAIAIEEGASIPQQRLDHMALCVVRRRRECARS